METEDGLPDPVDALRFASDVLVPDRGVPLIVLGGCASPSGRGTGPAGGTLPRVAGGLLAHGVPAVVTMASDGDDRDTIRLASSFYRSLASRQNAPDPLAALSEARRELHRTRRRRARTVPNRTWRAGGCPRSTCARSPTRCST